MNNTPSRMQGGIFIWGCALFAAVGAIAETVRCCRGAGEFCGAVFWAAGAAGFILWQMSKAIRKHTVSPEMEKGPLLGLVCSGTSAFLAGYWHCLRESGSHGFALLCGLAWATALAWCLLLVGRGLNRQASGLHGEPFSRRWMSIPGHARIVCGILMGVWLLGIVFAAGRVLSHGMSLPVWKGIGISFGAVGGWLALAAGLRPFVFRTTLRAMHLPEEFAPASPHSVCGDSFALHEYCTALAFGGTTMIAFMYRPAWAESAPGSVLAVGALLSAAALALVLFLARDDLSERFRAQWRGEARATVRTWKEECGKQHREALREWVVGHAVENAPSGSPGQPGFREMAEKARRTLNAVFCELGNMKYITGAVMADRGELAAKYAGDLFDHLTLAPVDREEWLEDASDTVLAEWVARARAGTPEIDEEEIEREGREKLTEVLAAADWAQLPPSCRFPLVFRKADGILEWEIELAGDGSVFLRDTGGAPSGPLAEFSIGTLTESIDRELGKAGTAAMQKDVG